MSLNLAYFFLILALNSADYPLIRGGRAQTIAIHFHTINIGSSRREVEPECDPIFLIFSKDSADNSLIRVGGAKSPTKYPFPNILSVVYVKSSISIRHRNPNSLWVDIRAASWHE
jgi:hypothetical protein